jgi:hypothetical protein
LNHFTTRTRSRFAVEALHRRARGARALADNVCADAASEDNRGPYGSTAFNELHLPKNDLTPNPCPRKPPITFVKAISLSVNRWEREATLGYEPEC